MSRQITKQPKYRDPADVLTRLLDTSPLIGLFGGGRFAVLGLAGEEVEYEQLATRAFAPRPEYMGPKNRFATGYIGILPYDTFCPFATEVTKPRVFRISKSILWDQENRVVYLAEDDEPGRHLQWVSDAALEYAFTDEPVASINHALPRLFELGLVGDPFTSLVARAVQDIRDGNYYQINLLRYFRLHASFDGLLKRLLLTGGNHSAVFRIPGLELLSFSPEKFVGVMPQENGSLTIDTSPIKGTKPRDPNPTRDAALKAELNASPKERAELAMIIDLMRNDLHRVCAPHTVDVISPGEIETLSYVHHRLGKVVGQLRAGITLGELLIALMPGGSITGAPKRAAMGAIRAYEGRDRGFFMGTAFCWDLCGYFDSSILIRTAVRKSLANDFEFAAGSGIVLGSKPEDEAHECLLKCRAVSDLPVVCAD